MSKQNQIRQQLEEYHLLWQENCDRLNRLELLRALAEAQQPLSRQQLDALFIERCILTDSGDPERGRGGALSVSKSSQTSGPPAHRNPPVGFMDGLRMAAWYEYCDYRTRITPQLSENRRKMCRLEEEISSLPQPLEREVLRLRYLDSCCCRLTPWKLVALRLYGNDDTAAVQYVRRLHDMAVQSLTAA